jgi:hypothetical protein
VARPGALAEFALDGFARDEVTRLEEAQIRAIELKTEADLGLGRHAELAGELKALVAAHPLRERLRGQLMLALYRSGRQGEALRVYQEGREALADELGVDPGAELQELHQQILLQAASLSVAPQAGPAPPGNLPAPVTSFVGRRAELHAATESLRTSRLVTLTEAGGCGKTRLALEVAMGLVESFADGVWLTELEAAARQEPERAAVLLGAAESIRARAQAQLAQRERTDVEPATAAARSALGQEAFTAAVERGRRMTVRQALGAGPP